MSVTLEQITTYLDNTELKYKHYEEQEVIVLMLGNENSIYSHYIRTRDNGDIFEWQMQILDDEMKNLNIKDHQYTEKVLSHILYLNYKTKFGTWEFNPENGDIRLAVEIPLEDALMTEKQFKRVMGLMLNDGHDHAKQIAHILNTGKTPEDDSQENIIALLNAILEKEFKTEDPDDDSDGI